MHLLPPPGVTKFDLDKRVFQAVDGVIQAEGPYVPRLVELGCVLIHGEANVLEA